MGIVFPCLKGSFPRHGAENENPCIPSDYRRKGQYSFHGVQYSMDFGCKGKLHEMEQAPTAPHVLRTVAASGSGNLEGQQVFLWILNIERSILYVRNCVRRCDMNSVNVTNARKDLYKLVQKVNLTHDPVEITGKDSNAVLVGEEDWRSIQETLLLVSIPGMRESIIEGMNTPIEDLSDELNW